MAIGHKNQSMTFIPSVAVSLDDAGAPNFVFLDCPGFMDNRGAEVRWAMRCEAHARGVPSGAAPGDCDFTWVPLQLHSSEQPGWQPDWLGTLCMHEAGCGAQACTSQWLAC